jgi:hypothetical protein
MSPKRHQILAHELDVSQKRLETGDAAYFWANLPRPETWRVFSSFVHSTAYVDIETTGGWGGLEHITTIAAYDHNRVHTFVHGQNLEQAADILARPQLLVTYNGSCFDLPCLKREMGIPAPAAHIDLRFLLAGLGFCGGLKGCERQLGLDRGELDGFDGYMAVILWHLYTTRQDSRYLTTLLRYNCEDVINLELLMVEAWNRKTGHLPFSAPHLSLPRPELFPNPYPLHPEVLEDIRPFFSGSST